MTHASVYPDTTPEEYAKDEQLFEAALTGDGKALVELHDRLEPAWRRMFIPLDIAPHLSLDDWHSEATCHFFKVWGKWKRKGTFRAYIQTTVKNLWLELRRHYARGKYTDPQGKHVLMPSKLKPLAFGWRRVTTSAIDSVESYSWEFNTAAGGLNFPLHQGSSSTAKLVGAVRKSLTQAGDTRLLTLLDHLHEQTQKGKPYTRDSVARAVGCRNGNERRLMQDLKAKVLEVARLDRAMTYAY